jgi:1-acyl-sn-glycerol-3-phosphate acyltransferase
MIVLAVLATIGAVIGAIIGTLTVAAACVVAGVLKVPDSPRAPYDAAPRLWSILVMALSGVRVKVHNRERFADAAPRIFVANHVSWFDIPALASQLKRGKFVSKAEVFRVPIFGAAMKYAGMVPVDRQNRKAAFGAYSEATKRIQEGKSIVVYPEGTRGYDYPLRPFKKGPFVLAIDAGAPIVPVLIHGTREVLGKGSFLVRPGRVDVHLLEPISVEGMDYADRDRLAADVRSRIADALKSIYGIESPPQTAGARATNELQPSTSND